MSTPTDRPHGTMRGTRQKGSPHRAPARRGYRARPVKSHAAVKIQQIDEVDGGRGFALVCDRGADPIEALPAAAKRFDLAAASPTGIGASSAVTLGFFDRARRDHHTPGHPGAGRGGLTLIDLTR
jgi:hypothetical protein